MPYKIRTKLILSSLSIIFLFIVFGAILVLYSAGTIHRSVHKVQSIAEERAVFTNLILTMEAALLRGHDYIVTGNKKHIDDFHKVSDEVEKRMKEAKRIVHDSAEEGKILDDTNIAWLGIKETSLKLFAISNPAGNRDAAMLMQEMDYKLAYPAIKRLKDLREMHIAEFQEAVKTADKVWVHSWIIMISGVFVFTVFGIFFSFFYSSRFSGPIEKLHDCADAIAGGDFKARIEIKTGDELEQLSDAMNQMAAQLESLYSNLEQKVEERTRDLKESEKKYRDLADNALIGVYKSNLKGEILYVNYAALRIYEYESREGFISDGALKRYKNPEDRKVFIDTLKEKGTLYNYELELLTKTGKTRNILLSARLVEDEISGMIMDITEHKQAELALAEQLDELRRWHVATSGREGRILDHKHEVNELLGQTGQSPRYPSAES